MKIILVGNQRTSHLMFSRWHQCVLSLCLLGLPMGIGTVLGYFWSEHAYKDWVPQDAVNEWQASIEKQKEYLEEAREITSQHFLAINQRMAEWQSRLTRLDALGERLIDVGQFELGEFDFSRPPAQGGPLQTLPLSPDSWEDLTQRFDQVARQIENREQQLQAMQLLMVDRDIENNATIEGRPIDKGWLSSHYGERTDPFTGKLAWHSGVDFAGQLGASVKSVGAGVVTWSGKRHGYGMMVEVSHGDGYATRYAHNSENLVALGDIVSKGQVLAKMGSSGRSTGPHVHFEVYKNGRAVDPASYIRRTRRK